MRLDELQIHDFVMTAKGEIVKVESISTEKQGRKIGYIRSESSRIKYAKSVEPIPLTKELLVANGWAKSEDSSGEECYLFKHSNNAYDDLGYYFSENRIEVENVGVKITAMCYYVHDLQQALRLCGFNDLANDFKVVRNSIEDIIEQEANKRYPYRWSGDVENNNFNDKFIEGAQWALETFNIKNNE